MLARNLGTALAERYPGSVDPSLVETNMVRVEFSALDMEWVEVSARLDGAGIKINPPIAGWWRIVAHRDVDSDDVSRLLQALE